MAFESYVPYPKRGTAVLYCVRQCPLPSKIRGGDECSWIGYSNVTCDQAVLVLPFCLGDEGKGTPDAFSHLPVVQNLDFCLMGQKTKDPLEHLASIGYKQQVWLLEQLNRFCHLCPFMTETTRWSRNLFRSIKVLVKVLSGILFYPFPPKNKQTKNTWLQVNSNEAEWVRIWFLCLWRLNLLIYLIHFSLTREMERQLWMSNHLLQFWVPKY